MERHTLKKCSKCGVEKSVLEFNKDRSKKDGLESVCKPCKRVRNSTRTAAPEVRAAVLSSGTKVCGACKQVLPLEHFSSNKRSVDGFNYQCRTCYQSAWQVHRYGITQAQKEEILAKQGGVCAICGATSPGPKDWHTDHCHSSLKVRGILCDSCNRALGFAKDDPTILRTMAAYIEMHTLT